VHTHHRQLRRHGDERDVNKMRVCAVCHKFIHDNVQLSYDNGWLVHSWDDPEEINWRPYGDSSGI
jgi:hypothetical protein